MGLWNFTLQDAIGVCWVVLLGCHLTGNFPRLWPGIFLSFLSGFYRCLCHLLPAFGAAFHSVSISLGIGLFCSAIMLMDVCFSFFFIYSVLVFLDMHILLLLASPLFSPFSPLMLLRLMLFSAPFFLCYSLRTTDAYHIYAWFCCTCSHLRRRTCCLLT